MSRELTARVTRPRAAGPLSFVAAARHLESQGHRLARLDIGEPHFSTPSHIADAALAAMRDGETKYVSPQGLPALRLEIASSARARGIDASSDEVVVASGVKPMLLYAMLALAGPGDEVLVPDPGYAGYAAAAQLAGASARYYPLVKHGDDLGIDVDALRAAISPATRVLVLNSPHNPTGMIVDEATLSTLAELAERHDLWIVSDEIYSALTFDRPASRSIAAMAGMRERTIVVDGFSKSYAMTGWRIGFAILPPALVAPVTALIADAATCTPPFVQHAGIAALRGTQDFIEQMRCAYRERRDSLVRALRVIPGVDVVTPAGALYAFADVGAMMDSRKIHSSAELALELLQDHGLACVPGSAFGPRGERHLRFSFAVGASQMDDAVIRLGQWGGSHPRAARA